MRELISYLQAEAGARLGTVLHLGAGTGSDVDAFMQLGAERIVLVEPNPQLAERLNDRVRGSRTATVIAEAVAPTPGEGTLFLVNNPRESSLCSPEGLFAAYPNLRVVGEVVVPLTTLASLLERAGVHNGQRNVLVMEVQGLESQILDATPAQLVQEFTWIAVRTSSQPMYAGGSTAHELGAALERLGFESVGASDSQNVAAFQDRVYRRCDDKVRLSRMEMDLRATRDRLGITEEALRNVAREGEEQEARIAALASERETLVERAAGLESSLVATTSRAAVAEAECASLRAEAASQSQVIAAQRTELDACAAERVRMAARLAELEADNRGLEERVALDRAEVEQVRHDLQRQVAEIESLASRAAGLESELAETTGRAAIAEADCVSLRQAADSQSRAFAAQRLQSEECERERAGLAARVADLNAANRSLEERVAQLHLEAEQVRQDQQRQVTEFEVLAGWAAGLEADLTATTARAAGAEAECVSLREAADSHSQSDAAMRIQLAECACERDGLAARAAELEVANRGLEDGVALHRAEDEQVRQNLQQQVADFQAQLTEQQRQTTYWHDMVDSLQQRADGEQNRAGVLAQEVLDLSAALAARDDEKRQIDSLLAAERVERQRLQQQVEQYVAELPALRAELLQARQTANLASKLQTLREADLDDLQQRFEKGQLVQQSQHRLLLQLEEKLRVAAQYFHQLQQASADMPALAKPAGKLPSRPRAAIAKKAAGAAKK